MDKRRILVVDNNEGLRAMLARVLGDLGHEVVTAGDRDEALAREDLDGFVKVITTAEATKNDFNLSPSRYITSTTGTKLRELPVLLSELKSLDTEAAAINKELAKVLPKLATV